MKHKARRRAILAWAISGAVAAAVALAIALAVIALRGRESVRVAEAFRLYVHGKAFDYPKGTQLQHKDGVTLIVSDGQETNLEDCPLLLASKEIMLQRSMVRIGRENEDMKRVDYFSGLEKAGNEGFLYDNEDTYIFLEPVTLEFNGREPLALTPPAVVQVGYRQYIQIYGPNAENLFEYLEQDRVTATFADRRRLHLEADIYFEPNGVWRLLFVPLELLDPVR